MEENKKEEIQRELLKTITELEKTSEIEHLLKDNTIVYRVNDIDYRVRKTNYADQLDIEKYRRKKYFELVSDDNMMFKKQWVEKYKGKGIDIKKMEDDISRLQAEIDSLLLRLATTTSQPDIDTLKKDITGLKGEQIAISVEKTDLLSYSIEDQLQINVNSYYTYVVLEKKENDKWIRVFAEYPDFLKSSNSELINKSFYYVNYIIYNVL